MADTDKQLAELPKLIESFLEDIGPDGVEYVDEYRKDKRIEDALAWKRMKDRWEEPRQYDDISTFITETLNDPNMFDLLHWGGTGPIRYFFSSYLAHREPFEKGHILSAICEIYEQEDSDDSQPNKCVVS